MVTVRRRDGGASGKRVAAKGPRPVVRLPPCFGFGRHKRGRLKAQSFLLLLFDAPVIPAPFSS